MHSIGIILARPLPGKQVVWLLDRKLGHVRAFIQGRVRMPLSNGALMSYTITERADQLSLSDMQLEQLPTYPSLLALHFGHHLLQVVHIALPQGYADERLFVDLVTVLAHGELLAHDYERQQIIVGKLCAWMGIISSEQAWISALMHTPMEKLLTMEIDLQLARKVQACVIQSLAAYPGSAKLQYIQFVKGYHQ